MRVEFRFLRRLRHHLISLKSIKVEERRKAVEVHLITEIILFTIEHIGLVHKVSTSRHISVVGRHSAPVTAITPIVCHTLQAVNNLVPFFIKEICFDGLLILMSQFTVKEL
jgi:hypothetical protein